MLISWISWLSPGHWLGDHEIGSPSQGRLCSGMVSTLSTLSTPLGAMLLLVHWHSLESQYVSFLCSQAALIWRGENIKENVLFLFFLTSPNCQTGHSQSHVTILKRPGDRDASHDQPQPQILCVSFYSLASFLSASNVTPIIAGKRPHFQKKRNHLNLSPCHPPPRSSVITEWTLARRGMRQFSSLISSISLKFRQLGRNWRISQ